MGLVFGELFNFARHTVTQSLLTLGLTEAYFDLTKPVFRGAPRERLVSPVQSGAHG